MNNNCTCRIYGDKFLIVFQEIEPEKWQLIEAWMGVWKRDTEPQDDNLSRKTGIWKSMTVSPDYDGCPHCQAKGIFICSNCHTVNCSDTADEPVLKCAACQADGVLTPIQEFDPKKV